MLSRIVVLLSIQSVNKTDSATRVAVHEVRVMYKESKRICVAGEASIPVARHRDDRGDI